METIAAVHLAEGFEEIEAITIIDVLRRAEIKTLIVSVTGNETVTGSHGIKVTSDILFEDADYDSINMIILPGGMPGAANLKNHEGLNRQILDFHSTGKPLGAICAAPLVFGNLGILENHKATCYPGFENQLTGAEITGSKVETSGKIVTGKGPGAAIQFALQIVEMLKGKPVADKLAADMIV